MKIRKKMTEPLLLDHISGVECLFDINKAAPIGFFRSLIPRIERGICFWMFLDELLESAV
jgi:hypothetical protein